MFNFIKMLLKFFAYSNEIKNKPISPPKAILENAEKKPQAIEKEKKDELDWENPNSMVSKYFTVKNAIYLPRWSRLANEKDGLNQEAKDALIKLFNEVMDPIRVLIGKPIKVHVSFRSQEYNVLIGGAKMSIHMARKYPGGDLVAACDWSADMEKGSVGANCDEIKKILIPKLKEFGIRLEDNGAGATWIHVDNRKPGPGGRFFKP